MTSLAEVREELTVKRDRLHQVFEQAGGQTDLDLNKVTLIQGDNDYKASEIRRLHDEINELGREYDRLEALSMLAKNNEQEYKRLTEPASQLVHPGAGGGSRGPAVKSLRQAIETHREYKAFKEGKLRTATLDFPDLDFKTLITLSGISPQAMRREPVNMALEERTVADLMLQGGVDGNSVEYYEETTVTNAATTVSEGSSKPESALAWTLRTEPIRKIATWIPATDEALADVPFLESQIRGRLAYMVQRVEEAQVLSGDGNAPNLEGILERTGLQSYALNAEPVPDAIYRGMQLVRGADGEGFAEPTGVVMHPNDWTDVKLLRTTDGIYIWGNPSDEGPDRIWGLMVRQTTAMTENTALVGAFRPYAEVLRRSGITITLSTEHASYFIENKVAILAEERIGLAVYRPSAFCEVTGI